MLTINYFARDVKAVFFFFYRSVNPNNKTYFPCLLSRHPKPSPI